MLQNAALRPLIGLPLAALIVFGLYSFMNSMISQDYEQPGEVEQRELIRFTPPESDVEEKARPRDKPEHLQTADKPPPPPKYSATPGDVNLPMINIEGAAPTDLKLKAFDPLAIGPVAISDRDVRPIRPPVPTYPARAAERALEGACNVRLDVNTRGRPFNVEAECTDGVFKREAERAVRRVEFVPKIVRGRAVERHNVIYPLDFRLDS
ncbi:MAG: TonB family protein [Henriciella sp.]|uniref:TonB family protein n=1 Tax=Henriciella sp. TaxID=1968823 RepID=UPI003C7683BA